MDPAGKANVLNSEFYTFLQLYKSNLERLSPGGGKIIEKGILNDPKISCLDRSLANQWVTKLKDYSARLSDMKMRNTIVAHLIMQMQLGTLTAPFNTPPRFASLDQVQPIPELTAENVFPTGLKLPQIMQQSPDQGAFLVSQPVPKCGAFCYLAVVSRPPNH